MPIIFAFFEWTLSRSNWRQYSTPNDPSKWMHKYTGIVRIVHWSGASLQCHYKGFIFLSCCSNNDAFIVQTFFRFSCFFKGKTAHFRFANYSWTMAFIICFEYYCKYMLIAPGSKMENRINILSCIINKKRALDIFAHRHCFNKMQNLLCKMVVWPIHLPPNCKMHSNCSKDDYTHTRIQVITLSLVCCAIIPRCHWYIAHVFTLKYHHIVYQTEAHFLYFLHIQFYNDHFIAEVSFWVFFLLLYSGIVIYLFALNGKFRKRRNK